MNIHQIPVKGLRAGDLIIDEYTDELNHTAFIERLRHKEHISDVKRVIELKWEESSFVLIMYQQLIHMDHKLKESAITERSTSGYMLRYLKNDTYFAIIRDT